jgi:hypothetical protein
MLYPIWQPLPRARPFPEDPELDRSPGSFFDPAVGYFALRMMRRTPAICGKGCSAPRASETCPRVRACECSICPTSGRSG